MRERKIIASLSSYPCFFDLTFADWHLSSAETDHKSGNQSQSLRLREREERQREREMRDRENEEVRERKRDERERRGCKYRPSKSIEILLL